MAIMAQMNIERYKKAAKLRESGMSFKSVGKEMGVTAGRARQMCLSWPRIKEKMENAPGELEFPLSVMRVLYHMNLDFNDLNKVAECVKNNKGEMLKCRNFGKKSYAWLANYLVSQGYLSKNEITENEKINIKIKKSTYEKLKLFATQKNMSIDTLIEKLLYPTTKSYQE